MPRLFLNPGVTEYGMFSPRQNTTNPPTHKRDSRVSSRPLKGRHANFSLTCESEVGVPGHLHWHPHQCISRRNHSIINAAKRLDQLIQNCAKPAAKPVVKPTAIAEPSPTQEPRPVAKPAAGGVNWLLIAIVVACVLALGALGAVSQHPAVQAKIFGPANTGLPKLMGSQPGGKGPRDAGTGYNPVDNN